MKDQMTNVVPPLREAWDELVRNGAECVYDPELHDGPANGLAELHIHLLDQRSLSASR